MPPSRTVNERLRLTFKKQKCICQIKRSVFNSQISAKKHVHGGKCKPIVLSKMEHNNIEITYFINPHKFWFKVRGFDKKFIEFDIGLQNYLMVHDPIGGNSSNDYNPDTTFTTNTVVAYFDQKWQRWFRGTIQTKLNDSHIQLFLLDFGFPVLTTTNLIREIPIEFQLWNNDNLKFAGINQLLPATAELNVALFDIQINATEEWSSNAISIVQKIIAESSSTCFISEFELNGQLFGKLYANKAQANMKQEISSILIKLQHAVFIEDITDKFHNRPLSALLSLTNFSRCESPTSGVGDDFGTGLKRRIESSTPELIVPTTNLTKPNTTQEHGKFTIKSAEASVELSNEINSSSLVDGNETGNKIDSVSESPISKEPSILINKSSEMCKPNDEVFETDEPYEETVFNQSKSLITNTRNRKASIQSETSSFSESKTIRDYSGSDVDSCISSSPHLAKIFNKMRTIQKREQTKLKHPDNARPEQCTNISTVIEVSKDIDNQDVLENQRTSDTKYKQAENLTDHCNGISLAEFSKKVNNQAVLVTDISNVTPKRENQIKEFDNCEMEINITKQNDGKLSSDVKVHNCDEKSQVNQDTSKSQTSPLKQNEPAINVRSHDTYDNLQQNSSQMSILNTSSANLTQQSYRPLVNITPSVDSDNINTSSVGSSESFETNGIHLQKTKGPSDTSSIGASTIKTSDSTRHSNSADNESSTLGDKFSTSNAAKSHHKVFTKKLSNTGNKYQKSSDPSITDSGSYLRPTFTTYDPTRQNTKKYTFFEKEQRHIVLVHGHTAIDPAESLEQINFSKNIHRALDQLAINRLFRIDSYTWPHCLNGTSFVVIGAERTGKTISYLPAVINLILMEEEDNGIVDGVGPVALIIAPSSEKVTKIFDICRQINQYLDNKLIICKGHGIPSDKLAMNLLNGVHILISTPGCLDRLLDSSCHLINTERLKFFVIDDYHLMTDQINLIKKIIRSCCVLNPETELYEQQIIVTSVYWHNTFMAMLNKTNNSFICIGSYMESAYYAKQDVKLLFMRKEDKLNKLVELLSNKEYRIKHTLIVCRDSTEVDSVVKHLTDWNLDVMGCSRNLSSELIIKVINEWNDRNECSLKCVVSTDDMLPELHLNRVKVLIHFSLSTSWSKFQYRYSTFFESMPNLLKNETLETKSIVFIDETNNSELPRFIDFLKIHGVKQIHPAIEHISDEIRNQKDIEKEAQNIEFCKSILKFGICRKQNVCQFRHRFSDMDKSIIDLDIQKYIKIKMGYVSSPAHFYANILSTRNNSNDKWIDFDKEDYKVFNIKFKLHYSVKANHMQHPSCKIGDMCTINIVQKFYRCKILNVGEKRGTLSDRRVVVNAIDVGQKYDTTESRLLLLPDEFKTIPPKLIHVRLGGLIPIDNDIKWDIESTRFVEKYFAKYEQNPELFLEASSSFIIKDTIYVDRIVFKQDLGKFGGGELEIRNYKTEVIENKIGISDEKSFKFVKELVRAADFELFEQKILLEKEPTNLNPSPPRTPPPSNEISAIIPNIASRTPPTETSVIIPTIAEKPLLKEHKNSDSHSIFETSISDDDSRTKLSDTINSTTKSPIEPLKKTSKPKINLGVSLPNKIESINLSSFTSPSNFYVQKMSSLSIINTRLFDIQEYLIESNKKKLENFTVGDICLVLYDGYYDRAEIMEVTNDEIIVIMCDLGFINKYSKNDLYDADEIIKYQPFEAIQCQLFGVEPIDDDEGIWTENQIDEIYDYINDNYTDHYVKKVMEINSESRPKYSVMLCGVNGAKGVEIINKKLIENGWAHCDEEVRAIFDQSCEAIVAEFQENINNIVIHNNNNALMTESEEERFFNSLSYEDCLELFNFNVAPDGTITEITERDVIPDNSSKAILHEREILPRATITEITDEDITSDNNISNIKTYSHANNTIEQINSYDNDPPSLISCYNLLPLETLWHQDAATITLKINVTDHVAYRIELHKRLVNVCVQFDDRSYREITINLFGVVDINNFVHTIIGNYLKIVLTKSIQMNLMWPRLPIVDRKSSWLRYNYDTFKDLDLKDDYIEYKIKCVESSSDTDSNGILDDDDDEYNPFSMQYNFTENKYFEEDNV